MSDRTLISRRLFLRQFAAIGVVLQSGDLLAQEPAAPVVVHTKSGEVRGVRMAGVRVFRGVPFADPPIGSLRFRPPVPKKPWIGEWNATQFAAAAMQSGDSHIPQSEDCLYLNIWAPEGKGPFPIYVWIHGGGLVGGRSFDPLFDGSLFAREGILCITVAYRLGVFGFLDVEPLLGAEYRGSANNGLRDIVAALDWVRGNASEFGGDPSRVTVGGQSAGAKLTGILMGVPSARPLFQQMTSESGGAERVWSQVDAGSLSSAFGQHWRNSKGREIRSMLSIPAPLLINAQTAFLSSWPRHFPLRPQIDGTFLPHKPVETIAKGSTRGKRLLIGTTKQESVAFVGPHPAHDATAGDLGNMSLPEFQKIYRRYAQIYPNLRAARTPESADIAHVSSEYVTVASRVFGQQFSKSGASCGFVILRFTLTRVCSTAFADEPALGQGRASRGNELLTFPCPDWSLCDVRTGSVGIFGSAEERRNSCHTPNCKLTTIHFFSRSHC